MGQAMVVHRQGDRDRAAQRILPRIIDTHSQCCALALSYGTQPEPREQFADRLEAMVDRANGDSGRARDRLDRSGSGAALDDDRAGGVENRIG